MYRALTAGLLALSIAACSGGGLAPGLTARMDAPGAQLDRAEAINIINQFRASKGVAPLILQASLNQSAGELATQYAQTGSSPQRPPSADAMRLSAGYANFAETFSGWRGTTADASALIDPNFKNAGISVAYNDNSAYGVHWVLLLDDGV